MNVAATRTMKAGFAFDTLIGVILVTAGAYGAKWVASPVFWQSIDPATGGEAVGNVRARKGAVRVRSAGKSVWRDVTGIESVRQGDTVATGAGGVADLVLTRHDRLRIAPESLVVVDVAEAPAIETDEATGFGSGWFAKVVDGMLENQKNDGVPAAAARTFLKVKKGSVALMEPAVVKAGRPQLQLEIGGKKMEAKAAQAVTVSADGQAKVTQLTDEKVQTVEQWAPPPPRQAALDTPRVESPVQGAVFAQQVPVPFGWMPPARAAVSQIEIRLRGTSQILAQREFPGTGASLRLAAGEYEWRVRLRAQETMDWSAWSEPRVVTVVAQLRKDEPVAVLQSRGGVPAQGRAALAARDNWRETAAQARRLAAAPSPVAKPAPVVPKGPSAEELAARAKSAAEARQRAFAEAENRRKLQAAAAAQRATALAAARATMAAEQQKRVAAEKKARAALQTAVIAASLTRKVATEGKTAAFDPDKLDRIPVDIAWGSVPGAHAYRIVVYQGGKPTRQEEVRMPKYAFEVRSVSETAGLEYEITALMADGSMISGARSAIQVALGTPSLVEPSPGGQVAPGQNSVFSWSRTALADGYEVQVAPDESFTNPLLNKAVGDNFEFLTMPSAGQYYWRVRANAGAVKSAWSKANRFVAK